MEPDMLERLADREDAVSVASASDRKARQWVIRVIAMMLIVQAVVLMYVSGATGLAFNWQRELADPDLSPRALDTLLLLGVLLPVAVFEVMTAIGIWLGRGSAWLNALILQGLLLIYCLSLYIGGRSRPFVYVLMLLCILTVLYLNANDVRLTFQSGRRSPGTSRP